jgi:hypothetical protein
VRSLVTDSGREWWTVSRSPWLSEKPRARHTQSAQLLGPVAWERERERGK